jgi:two-component system, chemotaxis family, chemotaxis protein CheY
MLSIRRTFGGGTVAHNEQSVLIVEDDPTMRRLYHFLLTQGGYTIYEAEDGIEALEQIAQHPCNLVITDMNMPFMDGLELIRVIRRDYPSIYVILITAFGATEIERKALEIGADEYISKPFYFEDLEHRIQQFFQNRERTV